MWNILGKCGALLLAASLACLVGLGWLKIASAQQKSPALLRSPRSTTDSVPISLSTPDRIEDRTWWPTAGTPPRSEYVGTAECAKCHYAKVTAQMKTEMAHAATRAADPAFLDGQPQLRFRQSPYDYEIGRTGDVVVESVSDGQSSVSQPVRFAFGQGLVGHTYIYQTEGSLYESHVSYYSDIKGLDVTTGHLQSQFAGLSQALGRLLEPQEAQKCFGCHTTASTTSNHFDPSQAMEGVTCEGCHGPGARHVRSMMAGQIARGKASIFNPASLDAGSSVDFCGACHRTSGDVLQLNVRGVVTVRFQPFRLEESRCWKSASERLTCVTCHNPHEPLVQDATDYDHVCLRCHSGGQPPVNDGQVVCKISRTNCTGCHMPRVEIPGMHHAFADHRIRITTDKETYPN